MSINFLDHITKDQEWLMILILFVLVCHWISITVGIVLRILPIISGILFTIFLAYFIFYQLLFGVFRDAF